MFTLMLGCELSNSGRIFFRSAIDGLSTAASVIVVVPAPPPPPPAPEHAPATNAITSPAIASPSRRSCGRSLPSLMQSHPSFSKVGWCSRWLTTLSDDNVVFCNTDLVRLQQENWLVRTRAESPSAWGTNVDS